MKSHHRQTTVNIMTVESELKKRVKLEREHVSEITEAQRDAYGQPRWKPHAFPVSCTDVGVKSVDWV